MNPHKDLCEGCGRTREEVMRWLRYTEEERLRIMAELEERMKRAFSLPPAQTQ